MPQAENPPVYFGYGSIAYLDNWKWFISEAGTANIKPSPGDKVYGLVFEISKSDEQSLDRSEGVPKSYIKVYHNIILLGTKSIPGRKDVEGLVYINETRLKESPPRTEYIHRMNLAIADGIREGIPEDYMEKYLRPFIPREHRSPDDL
ncbi:hypothetical protein NP233_g1875 [Leucocoprinus birnbaumii]|uniref:gamma-glutamylcyclotransferase n=1 Tax=Leucocoprinus birnbaumii TaxID=56174 RepID=A0AAD5VZS0_9AGAR|nr:hypothetical protein NP233_g1875 [Leucocoprinus birnbaumii]